MRRTVLALTLAAIPLAAQQPSAAAPAAPAVPPAGWTIRLDAKDTTQKPEDTKFVTMGQGFHVTSGPAAIYFHPKNMANGTFTVRASFGQRTAPAMGHAEAYGVFIGGSQLDDYAKQQYVYLVVRGDGKYFVAHRAGADVHKIVDWTAHEAVKSQNAAGAVTNEVAITVAADAVHMMVNGTSVKTFTRAEMKGFVTDGTYGLRVNHGLNVHIANFGLQQ